MDKMNIKDVNMKGKKVLVRVDFNVPMQDGEITDENRIIQSLPTIKYITDCGGKAILFSHLGRVKTEEDKASKSLAKVAVKLSELLGKEVKFIPYTWGFVLEDAIKEMKDGDVLMFENTRFEDIDGKRESKNDPALGKYWASLGDIFVNDAFGTAHRAHASNVGISTYINGPAVSGFLLEKEIEFLDKHINNPKRPFVAILGGAKVSDKIGVINNLLDKADKVIIGGGMSYTFLKAQGYEVGTSLCEDDKLDIAKELLEKGKDKLVFPVDYKLTKEFSADAPFRVGKFDDIKADEMGLDAGPDTITMFKDILKDAKTVVWNGPVGVFEFEAFAEGTIGVCEAIANLDDAITIIGGGDSASAAINLGYADKFSHISTGGGASLVFLEGKELPGLEALNDCNEECECHEDGCCCGK